ncbi:FxDxF family PEP-CTERM protein [Methylomonas sp. AM2-LC]|uniref:FxDxF family PEP-CTERM protein n=1 Tax=Methylomonas sp. AM2-LC TaxID=3153301 RepID=UPI003262EEC6
MTFNKKSLVLALGLNMALICNANADLVNDPFLSSTSSYTGSGWRLSTDATGTGFTFDTSDPGAFGFGLASSNNIPVELYQVFKGLTVGAQYTISFAVLLDSSPSSATSFSANFGGSNLLTLNTPATSSLPVTYSFTETAVSSKEILSFSGYNSNGNFNYLTGPISVSAVPEAEEWAMMLLGLPLMGWVARRRQLAA